MAKHSLLSRCPSYVTLQGVPSNKTDVSIVTFMAEPHITPDISIVLFPQQRSTSLYTFC